MDTRQLLYFRAVVDHGSFTHAAESLDMTQPSLSLSIRKLEKELNAQLLSRGRSGVSTTEAGDYVYETAVKVDALLSETQRHISEITGDKASTVSLASGAILNWEFTPAALAELKRIYPTANISLDDAEPATAIKHLLDGQVDLGSCRRPIRRPSFAATPPSSPSTRWPRSITPSPFPSASPSWNPRSPSLT